jgi:23S rRNA (cytosine1962-C5)-methyltransferase
VASPYKMKTMLITKQTSDYELLDSGMGRKLERYGKYIFSRPDPEALWSRHLPESDWRKAELEFIRKGTSTEWKVAKDVPKEWPVTIEGLTFIIRPTMFKHTGLFPEQAPNWRWIGEKIIAAKRDVSVLNLFGYTGGATLAAAKAGAAVVHVDGSKMAITWARENAEASGLADKPVRWILDDAKAFLKKEIKRGNRYDGIIMDPPTFGHGPKNELWKIEDDFMELLALAREALSPGALFVLMSGYAAGYSPIAYENCLAAAMTGMQGTIESGELAIEETQSKRLLPAGIYAKWSK